MYDTARPYELVFERDFEMLVLVVPRHPLVRRAPKIDDMTAVAVSGVGGSGALTSSLLKVSDLRTARRGHEAAYLSDAAVDLVAACLAGCQESVQPYLGGESVVTAAHRYMKDHVSDPALSPAEVAAAVHVSLRHLQKLFERQGTTIGSWVRERGLEGCWRDLADPGLAHRSVGAIASSWGLVDAAQFSRTFRARYGATPRAHRAELMAPIG